MKRHFLIPLALFLVLAAFLAVGLKLDPHEVPSPLVGQPAPPFTLPRLHAGVQVTGPAASFDSKDMAGKVWVLNVWASWCAACRQEHPLLVEFAASGAAPLIGLDYKDRVADAKGWLARFGNPYAASAVDADGRVGIDYGVYGVPETYVIDQAGTVRFKHVGPLTRELLRTKVLPLIEALAR